MNPANDPAFPVLAVDIISNVLHRADNPSAMGHYLTEEIRELTGASCVIFLQCSENADEQPRIFSLHPQRKHTWAESPVGKRLIHLLSLIPEPTYILAGENTEAGQVLKDEAINTSFSIPLCIGSLKVGSLLVLGIPETNHNDEIKDLFSTLSALVALVLRNAFLFEKQETIIAERTRELRRANEALQLTKFSVDSANDAIFWINEEGRFVDFNKAACRLLSCSEDLLRTKRTSDINPSRAKTEWAIHWQDLRQHKALTFEATLVAFDGRKIPVEISSNHVTFGDQEFSCAFVRDLSERKALEERLRQAQKMEAVGQLAGGVAHDFNNILAAIMLQLGILGNKQGLDAEMQTGLHDLTAAARRAADLTRQLLIFSRRSVMSLRDININDLVEDVSKMLRRLIGENIDLQIRTSSNLPSISADQHMLDLVLMNLAINARDALPKGGSIEIRTLITRFTESDILDHQERRPGLFVHLSVRDNGHGMDAATQKRIFEPFFTTKDVGKGTGLGLATAHGIVAQHKGWIEVESEIEKGSCFHLYFPVSEKDAKREDAVGVPVVSGGNECILIVEDEQALRTAESLCLRRFGYVVLEAASGVEALDIWRRNSHLIRLVITDMVMPEGMTGLELSEKMRALKPNLKIIMSSGYSSTMPEANALKKLGIHYLPKPFDVQSLGNTVRTLLDSE